MRQDNNLENRIKDLQNAVNEIKSAQFSGNSNILSQSIETLNTWDIDIDYNSFDSGTLNYIFIFTSYNQKAPFASFHPKVLLNNTAYDGSSNMQIDTFYDFAIYSNFADSVNFEKSVGYVVSLFNWENETHNIKIKMEVTATDKGSVTVQQI